MKTHTAPFSTALVKTGHAPVTLIMIEIPANGANAGLTLRLSERGENGATTFSTPGNTWYALIDNVDRSATLADASSGVIGSDVSMKFTLVNLPSGLLSPAAKFSSLNQTHKLASATVTVYNWFDGEGLAEADMDVEFVGNISDVFNHDEKFCTFDVVSVSADIGKRKIGSLITKANYPEAGGDVLGAFNNIVIGEVPKVPCKRTNAIAITYMRGVFLPGDTSMKVTGPLDEFPSSGQLEINGDVLSYSAKTTNTFTGISGGQVEHFSGEQVVEKQASHDFLVSDPAFPIKSIDAVYVKDGAGDPYQLVESSKYTLDLTNNLVKFSELPTALRSTDSRFLLAHFDEVEPGSSAVNANNAIDPSVITEVSTINANTPVLAVKQIDAMQQVGEIGRVFVAVTYFQEAETPNDTVQVSIDDVGNIGQLDRQAAEDVATVAGSTDISHANTDNFGFPIDKPVPPSTNSSTAHKTLKQPATDGATRGFNILSGVPSGLTVKFPSLPGSPISTFYTLVVNVVSGSFGVGANPVIQVGGHVVARWNVGRSNFDYTPNFELSGQHGSSFPVSTNNGAWFISIELAERFVTYVPSVSVSPQAQNTVKSGGVSATSGTKSLTAVTSKASNVVTKLLEITSHVNGDWSWFKDKILRLTYTGSADGRDVYIALARFNIEYAQLTKVVTDRVYADSKGVKDDVSGSITGTPDALIERPDHFYSWSLDVGIAAKKDVAIGLFGGGTFDLFGGGTLDLAGASASYINAASFTAAGALFAAEIAGGYKIAGIIDALIPVRDIWATIGLNTRSVLYFKRGEAHIFFRPLNGSAESTATIRNLDKNDIIVVAGDGQEAIEVDNTPGDNIINQLTLKYGWDWGEGQFKADPIEVNDEKSQERYAVQKSPADNGFHWVRGSLMAQTLADFYLAEFKDVFKVVTFTGLFKNMDLDTFDQIGFRHGVLETDGGSFKPGLILGVNRQMGVGVRGRMDEVQLVLRMVNTGQLINDGLGLDALGLDGLGGFEVLDG